MTLRGVTTILKHRASEAKAKANQEDLDEVSRQAEIRNKLRVVSVLHMIVGSY